MPGRSTAWRQGCILTVESSIKLELTDASTPSTKVVIISHDCDLPNASENLVEVIVGDVVDSPEPALCHARHPRRLHLTYIAENSNNEVHIELSHAKKKSIAKSDFTDKARKDTFILPDEAKRALKQWLAARYGRPAFPNSFESRLRKKKGKKTVERSLGKLLEPVSHHLIGVFFDLGEQRSVELQDKDPYYLKISIVYDATEGGEKARIAAEDVATQIAELFNEVFGPPENAKEIALETCNAVADTFMSLADLRKVDQWRVEYISLKDNNSGDFLASGENSI